MNIIEALDAPELLGSAVLEFDDPSWDRWKVWLKALFGLGMTKAEMEVFRYHTGRTSVPSGPFRDAVLICGRRSGKSRILALIAVFWPRCGTGSLMNALTSCPSRPSGPTRGSRRMPWRVLRSTSPKLVAVPPLRSVGQL